MQRGGLFSRRAAKALRTLVLPALVVLMAGPLELHTERHELSGGVAPAEVFAAAHHTRETTHFEAAGTPVSVHCPACVLLKTASQVWRLAPLPTRPAPVGSLAAFDAPAALPAFALLRHPRAPPVSA